MRTWRWRVVWLALALGACSSALPPAVRVGSISALAGQYSGTLEETGEVDRSIKLTVEPDGRFELAASDPHGFRTLGRIAMLADGTLLYEYPEMRGAGAVARGGVTVHEGDTERVLVLKKTDGTMTMRAGRRLP